MGREYKFEGVRKLTEEDKQRMREYRKSEQGRNDTYSGFGLDIGDDDALYEATKEREECCARRKQKYERFGALGRLVHTVFVPPPRDPNYVPLSRHFM